MSKLQLLYEKLLKIAYIFSAIFFVLFLIDLFTAMVSGAIGAGFSVDDKFTFFKLTLYPLGIGTIIFLVAGRVFYFLANRESSLLSVSDYKKSLLKEEEEEPITREELYDKLRQGKRVTRSSDEPILTTIKLNFKEFFVNIGEFFVGLYNKSKDSFKNFKTKMVEKQELKQELKKIDQDQKEKDQAIKARTKLNKTELIILITEATDMSQNDSRLFLNTLLDTIRETVVANEEVKIAKFGRFAKVEIKETSGVEAYNTVEFTPFKYFIELFTKTATKEEPIKEEPTKEEPIKEEPVKEEPVKEEPVKEEPVKEEPVKEEPVIVPVKKVEVPAEQVAAAIVPKKPAKPKVVTKTKKQFIELIDATTDLSKNKANKFLKYFAEVVKEQLALRKDVDLEGIGFFTTIEMPAKEAVNPQTRKKIVVPAHHQVRLRFDEDLKDKMNR